MPRVANPVLIQSLTFARLYKRCCGRDADPILDRDGSIVLLGLFEWLGEDFDGNHLGSLRHLIIEEFNIYDWYYLARPSKPRISWARNMWFSLYYSPTIPNGYTPENVPSFAILTLILSTLSVVGGGLMRSKGVSLSPTRIAATAPSYS
ncbi:uncharacterized protein N7487_010672 [Penicillium crustosum]|uniref:uncharacterized protein n=1 Tax=Penicillium crustosum TaxID=36656 RepID=UPI002395854D|nr:uncharacterized protein N7487_010668 [Penicillium crustosum]XP_056726980.1 uncharacterized protein N7487_010670 [Penicillium crustosum]XP_056726982.1 uncharacterized protein N7487_010672 [Penicillium crustosum]KAJ5396365.1 hypothetical protein N7487_010668 [Penicillium crustosum]KAJ5396367.1 hypothetical protein N7487_010670 [Penicillium crustosum]KAJ5396369.1 hypothetical protein N7487_010672 [Penicillium crustosum]